MKCSKVFEGVFVNKNVNDKNCIIKEKFEFVGNQVKWISIKKGSSDNFNEMRGTFQILLNDKIALQMIYEVNWNHQQTSNYEKSISLFKEITIENNKIFCDGKVYIKKL